MKEIKRYRIKIEHTNNVKGVNLDVHIEGDCLNEEWCKYSDVEQLNARIKELESDAHINEIKALGIEWAVEQAAFDCVITDDPVSVLEKVGNYADELRGQNGSND